jgi:hypothetical protein
MNVGSVTMGFMPPVSGGDVLATTVSSSCWLGRAQRFRDLSGMTLNTVATVATGYTFQLPLICLIGTLGEKYIPLHALAADLRLEITLNTASCIMPADKYDHPMLGGTLTTNTNGLYPNINNGVLKESVLGSFVSSSASIAAAFSSTPTFTLTNVYLHSGMVQVSDVSETLSHYAAFNHFERSHTSVGRYFALIQPLAGRPGGYRRPHGRHLHLPWVQLVSLIY